MFPIMSSRVVAALLWCAVAFGQPVPPPSEVAEKESEDNVLRRMEYFYGPRRYPEDRFAPSGRLNAFREFKLREEALRSGKVGSRGAGLQDPWKLIGPRPINFSNGFIT